MFRFDVAAPGAADPGAADPLSTVGLALLAYGLVQLLGKIVDRVPFGRTTSDRPRPVCAFGDEDHKRLERVAELVAAESQRLQRMQESLATQQRLVGQALDELRSANERLDNIAKKLRGLFNRLGRRGSEGFQYS